MGITAVNYFYYYYKNFIYLYYDSFLTFQFITLFILLNAMLLLPRAQFMLSFTVLISK